MISSPIGREKLISLGVPVEYHAQAKHYAGVMRGLGMPVAQIETAIRFGAEFQGSAQERSAQFDLLCQRYGIKPDFASLSESWLDQVSTRGFDNMPPVPVPPVSDADRARLVQIRAEMRKPRSDSEYWRDPAMRDEYQELLERLEGGEGAAAPARRDGDTARKAELQALMRDRSSAYWREETGLSEEYRAILEREGGGPGDAGAAAGAEDRGVAEPDGMLPSE